MSFILCVTPLYLRDALTDWDETLRVYRVYPKLLQRHIFNFRNGSQTGNGPSPPMKTIIFRHQSLPVDKVSSFVTFVF